MITSTVAMRRHFPERPQLQIGQDWSPSLTSHFERRLPSGSRGIVTRMMWSTGQMERAAIVLSKSLKGVQLQDKKRIAHLVYRIRIQMTETQTISRVGSQ